MMENLNYFKQVYRQSLTGRRRLISFSEAGSIITESEYGSFCYCLTRKKDIFGKNIKISNSFRVSKRTEPQEVFEEKILPAIYEILGF